MDAFTFGHSAARRRSPALVVLLLLCVGAAQPGAQEPADPTVPAQPARPADQADQADPAATELLPAQQPFDLNLHNARMAKAMLERVGVVMLRARDGRVRSVGVRRVRIEYVGRDERYPEPFDRRFDLRLNGEALDWGATYIEYDFRMVNMQLLFTYRNQRPVPEGPYYLWGE
jgi:hypothetical protein